MTESNKQSQPSLLELVVIECESVFEGAETKTIFVLFAMHNFIQFCWDNGLLLAKGINKNMKNHKYIAKEILMERFCIFINAQNYWVGCI